MKHIGSHRLDAIQTPTNTYHNTRQVSTDPCRLLSIDPLRFPRVLSIDPLRFPRVLSIDPLRFPRVLSIDPLRFLRPLSIDPLRPFCTEPLLPISIEPLRPCRKRYKEMCGFKFLKKKRIIITTCSGPLSLSFDRSPNTLTTYVPPNVSSYVLTKIQLS